MTYTEQYKERIQRVNPILKSITFYPCDTTKAEQLLTHYTLEEIRTLQVIMIIGRHYDENNRKKPVKYPDKVYKSWDEYIGFDPLANIQNEIDYLLGKRDWQKWLKLGMTVLSISV